jgi:hypothetical protein
MFPVEGIELRFLCRPARSLVIISTLSTELPRSTLYSAQQDVSYAWGLVVEGFQISVWSWKNRRQPQIVLFAFLPSFNSDRVVSTVGRTWINNPWISYYCLRWAVRLDCTAQALIKQLHKYVSILLSAVVSAFRLHGTRSDKTAVQTCVHINVCGGQCV